jgi:hypothetical protein
MQSNENISEILIDLVREVKELKQKVDSLSSTEVNQPTKRKKIMNTGQVCLLLDKAPLTIYRMLKRGDLTGYKKGREWYFYEEEVISMLERGRSRVG